MARLSTLRNQLAFSVTPPRAGALFDREVPGFARLVERKTETTVGEFRFEADCEFVEPVVRASEMTIYPAFRGRGYAKQFLSAFFSYLRAEAMRRDEDLIVNGDITSKTILHVWLSVADALLFDSLFHDRTRTATQVHLFAAKSMSRTKCERLVAELPDLGPQDRRGFLKKPCAHTIGIASLIEP